MSEIKFHFADNDQLELNQGRSSFMDLLAIGAINLASKLKVSQKSAFYEYATDQKGLEDLILKSAEVLKDLLDASQALSMVMTNPKNEEVQENITELAWLLVGLTELSGLVAHNVSEMNHTLKTKKLD